MIDKRLITWLTVAYIALLTTLCLVQLSLPTPYVPNIGFDKIVHFGIYFGLNILLVATITAHKNSVAAKQIIATTLSSIAYGVVIEFIQVHVGRTFDLYDIAANTLGATCSALLLCQPKIKAFLARIVR